MAFQVAEFLALRPFVYHVTDRANLPGLRSSLRMRCTADLLIAAGQADLLRERRKDCLALSVDGTTVVLKDQAPLIEANTRLTGGWDFGDFVESQNRHVFFWPGTSDGPIGSGRRLLHHYEPQGPAVFRVATNDLLATNAHLIPLFCTVNSGAPRYHSGRPAPRGPGLFVTAETFARRASQVVEVVFAGEVGLPPSVQVRSADGWRRLVERR